MTTRPSHFAAPTSPLPRPRRVDPRVMVASTVAVVVASVTTLRGIGPMLGVLAFVCAGHACVVGHVGATVRGLLRLAPFALLIVALNAVLVPGEPLITVAGRRIVSRGGLEDGVFFALRLGVMVMAMTTMLAATSPETLARATFDFVRRFSARAAAEVALFVFLAMAFVPLFADEFERIRVAQGFRGGDFSGGLWRRVETARSWLVPLILSAVHRSGQLAFAVELRDVRHRLPRSIEPPRAGAADAAVLVLTAAVLVAASMVR